MANVLVLDRVSTEDTITVGGTPQLLKVCVGRPSQETEGAPICVWLFHLLKPKGEQGGNQFAPFEGSMVANEPPNR